MKGKKVLSNNKEGFFFFLFFRRNYFGFQITFFLCTRAGINFLSSRVLTEKNQVLAACLRRPST